MAGKSTYMRQVAVLMIMAQIGSFIPAREAVISPVDRIFTRVGASDDISTGQSTFMVEMNEVAQILRYATKDSLIILDEVGRGTSTFDGMSIARAVMEFIHEKIKAKTLFATHYHQLIALEDVMNGVKTILWQLKNVVMILSFCAESCLEVLTAVMAYMWQGWQDCLKRSLTGPRIFWKNMIIVKLPAAFR